MTVEKIPMKILLVDDDIHIRVGLEKIITDHFPSGEIIVFSCENGLIASQLMAQESIDLLVTDIKMPLCSGIDLLKIVNENRYACHSIVLSGYDDFNLVRSAMRLGASDYLLKPVDEGLLIHTIREFQNISRNTSLQQGYGTGGSESPALSSILKMQRILENLLGDTPVSLPDSEVFLRSHNINGQTNCLMCYVDIKRALYSNHLAMFQFLADRAQHFLSHTSDSNLADCTVIYGGFGSFWVFLLFSEKAFSEPSVLLEEFFLQLEKDHLKYSFTPFWFSFEHLRQADQLCRKGFEKYYFDLPYTTPDEKAPENALTEFLDKAVLSVAACDYAATIENLEHCFALLNILRPSIPDVKKMMNRFVYSILKQNSAYISIISSSKFTDYDILEHIETSESLSALQKNIYMSLNNMIEQLIQSMRDKDDFVIQKAKEYIKHNYQDDISLNDVASHVFLNSNYFSTLFRQKTGDTFRSYLRNVRIKKAKELLTTSNLRVYEIAMMVGYNEPSHFVRAFKTVTGKNPKDFREDSF